MESAVALGGGGMGKLIWQRGMDGRTYFISFLPSFFPESRSASRIIHLNFCLSVLILTESGGTRTTAAVSCVRATCITFRCTTPKSVSSASGSGNYGPAPPCLAYRRQVVAKLNSSHISFFETIIFTLQICTHFPN